MMGSRSTWQPRGCREATPYGTRDGQDEGAGRDGAAGSRRRGLGASARLSWEQDVTIGHA